jgi:hypothetical protein
MCDLKRCPYCQARLDDPILLEIAAIRAETDKLLWTKGKYWPWRKHLTQSELCEQAGLTSGQFEALAAAGLLNADDSQGLYYRPKLLGWAKKLAYLLTEGWSVAEIKRWSRKRWQSANPRQWPPERKIWRGS